jgi:hypothetical protein
MMQPMPPAPTMPTTLAERMFDSSIHQSRVAMHRLRRRFGELLPEEIAETVVGEEETDDELRYLFAAWWELGLQRGESQDPSVGESTSAVDHAPARFGAPKPEELASRSPNLKSWT